MPPRVSVNTIARDASATIAEAIESILAQSFGDFEYLVIDDHSRDDTGRIIERYASADGRIRRLDPEPQATLGQLRNQALLASQGEYVAILDADDVSLPDRLAREVEFLDGHPDHVLVGGACYDRRSSKDRLRPGTLGLITDADLLHATLPLRNTIVHSTVMYRREAAVAVGGYDERLLMAQDYALWLRLRDRGKLVNLPRALAIRRTDTGFAGRADPVTREAFARAARMIARYERQARRLREGDSLETVVTEESAFQDLQELADRESAAAQRLDQVIGEIDVVTRTLAYRCARRLVLSPVGDAVRWLSRRLVRRKTT
jgi:hypothetical protein